MESRTTTRSKLIFEQEVNVILNRMVAEAKRADATDPYQGCQNLFI